MAFGDVFVRPFGPSTTLDHGGNTAMSELDTEDRKDLSDSQFAYIDKDGDRKLPINDEEHIRNAISRFSQTDFDSADGKKSAARKIMDAAKDHDVDVGEDDDVRKALS
jgi:hypothetical protein